MKRIILPLFALTIALIGISLVLSSSSSGRAFVANSGNTGAPGESQVCGNCHTGGAYGNTSYQIELLDSQNNVVSAYIPGTVYTLRGTFTTPVGAPSPAEYGFQVVSLINNSTNYNAWSTPSANARIASASNGRSYTEHNGPSINNTYSVSWTAPTVGSGTVNFYSASNGVNNNNNTSGDNGFSDQLVITESNITSLTENILVPDFKFYPNPVEHNLTVQFPNLGDNFLRIFDPSGKEMISVQFLNAQTQTIDLSRLASGMYFINLTDHLGNSYTEKLLKN